MDGCIEEHIEPSRRDVFRSRNRMVGNDRSELRQWKIKSSNEP